MPSTARTRRKGKSTYVPTEQDRRTVEMMIGVQIDQNQICAVLDITAPTLRKHFRKELDTAYTRVLTQMRGKLIAKAREGDTAALIFYAKTHGWSEKITVEGEGDFGFGKLLEVLEQRRQKPGESDDAA
jgi:hypothetical protein